ncbi:TPA: DNA-binding protein Alba [Candidatus Bathyarchaeota archaeon]|nr:DNA-binding protein Alba [Candidatus Bathyarchaeota archaeon]
MSEKKSEKKVKNADENQILVGQKPVMKYVVACMTSFNAGSKKIVLKARGRAISRAVDTAELLRRVFMKDVEIENIEIGTEEVERADRPKSNVSTLEIALIRK